ncbi:hypothetical protein ACFQ36_02780 [Arthrobacter sp. GCM10027362]|uniref:hypothetical protein n=1 Tax=Arthrobacter sp. GCM10027362 TaxID=3273379 RepID=UPI0036271DDF
MIGSASVNPAAVALVRARTCGEGFGADPRVTIYCSKHRTGMRLRLTIINEDGDGYPLPEHLRVMAETDPRAASAGTFEPPYSRPEVLEQQRREANEYSERITELCAAGDHDAAQELADRRRQSLPTGRGAWTFRCGTCGRSTVRKDEKLLELALKALNTPKGPYRISIT